MSYAAGSAAAINHYLQAATELNVTPVMDSLLHHRLLLQKLKRTFNQATTHTTMLNTEDRARYASVSSGAEFITLLKDLFPPSLMQSITVSEILIFRDETETSRQAFRETVEKSIRLIAREPNSATYDRDVVLVLQGLEANFHEIQNDLRTVRDKVFSSIGAVALSGGAGAGALGSFASFLGGLSATGLVAASALTLTGTAAKKASELWIEQRSILRSQDPAVSYLVQLDSALARA